MERTASETATDTEVSARTLADRPAGSTASAEVQVEDVLGAEPIALETQGLDLYYGTYLALADIAEPAEDNHYWVDAEAVIQLSSKGSDPQWVDGFWDMLGKVEAYGYADLQAKRVKAHVETG